MFCSIDHQCTRRAACSPCFVDDQCGPDARCATDAHGGRYCAKTCAEDADCPPPQADSTGALPSPFERCRADLGGRGLVCQPTVGFCHGPSAIAGQPDGGVCAWCRAGENDCSVGTCFDNPLFGEHFCTLACTVTLHWNGTSYVYLDDSCPAGTFCFNGPPACGAMDCMVPGTCVGDPTYRFPTCYP
jgi:hypothetical protein